MTKAKKIVIVVTRDFGLTEEEVYKKYDYNWTEMVIRIVRTKLTGKGLIFKLNAYMRDNGIAFLYGDFVILWEDRKVVMNMNGIKNALK